MYEKTVAGIHKIYAATGSGSWIRVFDALSANAQAEITDLLTDEGAAQYYRHDPINAHNQLVRRLIVDGYLRYQNGNLQVAHSDSPGDDIEVLQTDEIYPTPVVNWIYDTYFNAPADATVIVRIFFS